ncbi:MAG: AMP-binding protein [Thermodesulfobacteriota bacterium]|nr:AMP-binding protein [Thermodesulfobacteriota bacterium]
MNIGNKLRDIALKLPDKAAVIFKDKFTTFSELEDKATKLALALKKNGIKKGDQVALIMPNSLDFVIAYFGVLKLGAILVPLDHRLTLEELKPILDVTKISTIITTGAIYNQIFKGPFNRNFTYILSDKKISNTLSFEEIFSNFTYEKIKVEIRDEDEALCLFTSGTSGNPKGVVLTFRNLVCSPKAMNEMLSLNKKTVLGMLNPMSHIGGPFIMNDMAMIGITMLIYDSLRPDSILKTTKKHRVTFNFGVLPIFRPMLKYPELEKFHLPDLQIISFMGMQTPLKLLKEFREKFPYTFIIQGYGLTETSPLITLLPLKYADEKMGSIGRPIPDAEVKIIDESGKKVPSGEIGELIVRGPLVMKEYYKNSEETKDRIKDGWLYTGDMVSSDRDGFLYLYGRKDDLIISGGLNVSPQEIEGVLLSHPDIEEACAVGVPDEKKGEVIKAVIVLKKGRSITKKDILNFCRERLAGYKIPRLIEFRNSIPLSRMGKVSRRELAESN